jgi:hypothetical protein
MIGRGSISFFDLVLSLYVLFCVGERLLLGGGWLWGCRWSGGSRNFRIVWYSKTFVHWA